MHPNTADKVAFL